MVENVLVKEQLTEDMVEAGGALTQQLLEMGVPVSASLWFYDTEINEWQLLIASPMVGSPGPLDVRRTIRQAREILKEQTAAIPLFGVSVLNDSEDLVKRLRAAYKTGFEGRQRLKKVGVEGRYIEDALLLRVA